MTRYVFTSESVSEGHPDKIADQISDAILDAYLTQDKQCHVACETLVKGNTVIIAGEITSTVKIDHEAVVRRVVANIGYCDAALGFASDSLTFQDYTSHQTVDLAVGHDSHVGETVGAGDQGLVFGYACTDTPTLIPAAIYYANRITKRLAQLRHSHVVDWLRPDAKSQISIRYVNDKPVAIETVVTSTQHAPDIRQDEVTQLLHDEVFSQVLPKELLRSETQFLVNPNGEFVTGGPVGDCGLTGRKTIVDSYGGFARDGGGSFSGKDPSKIDRSASYAARQVAKSVVATGLATRCEVQISYAIGVAKPISLYLNTFGTGKQPDEVLEELVESVFDLTPSGIITRLNLLHPIYQATASYGHFGRNDLVLPWEQTVNLSSLKYKAIDFLYKGNHTAVGAGARPKETEAIESSAQELKSSLSQNWRKPDPSQWAHAHQIKTARCK